MSSLPYARDYEPTQLSRGGVNQQEQLRPQRPSSPTPQPTEDDHSYTSEAMVDYTAIQGENEEPYPVQPPLDYSNINVVDSPYPLGPLDPSSPIRPYEMTPSSSVKRGVRDDPTSPLLDYNHVNMETPATKHGALPYTPNSPLDRAESLDHSESSSMLMHPSHRVLVDDETKGDDDEVPISALLDSYLHKSNSGAYRNGNGYASSHLRGRSIYRDEDSDISDEDSMADPYPWMTMADVKEPDDVIHDPNMMMPKSKFEPWRAVFNVGTIIILVLSVVMLFAGYPILHSFTESHHTEELSRAMDHLHSGISGYPKGIPLERANDSRLSKEFGPHRRMFIDPDTPPDAYWIQSHYTGDEHNKKHRRLKLVFSDEFNTEGRSFYPGEDPFWEAVDLHYWATNNLEWYDPAAITTRNGALKISLEQHEEHNMWFRGGMLQTWNKFCYRNGLVIARIQLPGFNDVSGLWPAFWVMGNLGRAGYGASLQGTWPYSYDQCDVGTVMNQTIWNSTYENGWPPHTTDLGGATMFNQKHNTTALSFLPGQKLSRCTCAGEDHPGPFDKEKGEFTGRAAPEIDVFEAQIGWANDEKVIQMSQSCQMAPYNWQYNITWEYGQNETFHFFDEKPGTALNLYTGEITQQSLSGTHQASQEAVQYVANDTDTDPAKNNFAEYSMEYRGGQDGYVVWTSDGKPSWELFPGAVRPDSLSKVGHRQYPKEPMYILLNLGISKNFGDIEWDEISANFPYVMSVDWVRVYQDPDDPEADIGCDPPDMPTADYIQRHWEAYTNSNYTIWGGKRDEGGYGAYWPLNRLYSKGCKGTPSKDPGDPDRTPTHASFVASQSVTSMPGAAQNWGNVYDVEVAPDAYVSGF